ncbi:uncharacterized protein LOC141614014 [Silene latifolia]|uniref:uncharacterized protein LOC141614014 n=1 Tax=Silene latifolia TaxID=37657 RepID=UPI003D772818
MESNDARIRELLVEFSDVFPDELPDGLPPKRGIEHQIDLLPGAALPNKPAYRCNPEEAKELQRQVQELIDRGYVKESLSPCAVPALLVPKNEGTWRMCIDSRAVNNITIKYRFLMPRLDDMLDELSGSCVFSKLDLRSGYHQMRIREGDEWKTAFKTKQGFKSEEEHKFHLRAVFEVMRTQKLYGKEGVSMDPSKVEAIQAWPVPKSTTEVHSFHGLASFYRRFIQGFSSIMAPITELTKKGEFVWTPSAQKAFEEVKTKLCSDSSLSEDTCLLVELDARLLGFEHIKELYKADPAFAKEVIEPLGLYTMQDGFLFKGNRLCIPQGSIQELIIREAHGGALAGHFGSNKTYDIVSEHFYWPKMSKDVQEIVGKCVVCREKQRARLSKGQTRLYLVPKQTLERIPIPKKDLMSFEAKERQATFLRTCEQVRAQIEKSNAKYKEKANKHRKQPVFKVGDLVWLHLRKERFPAKRKNKLMPRADGPFKVIECYGSNAYKLELPSEYGGVSATFNVGDLSPYLDDDNLRSNRTELVPADPEPERAFRHR